MEETNLQKEALILYIKETDPFYTFTDLTEHSFEQLLRIRKLIEEEKRKNENEGRGKWRSNADPDYKNIIHLLQISLPGLHGIPEHFLLAIHGLRMELK